MLELGEIRSPLRECHAMSTPDENRDLAPSASGSSPILAYVLPFVLFMVLGAAEGWEPLKPYYPFVYTAKIAIVLGSWCYFRRRYPAPSTAGLGWGILAGIVGVVVWIGLWKLNLERHIADILPSWLYSAERIGYDPFTAITSTGGAWAFIAVRLCGLALVVPLMEEVFWRGFLIRYLVKDDFESVPVGTFTPWSFSAVVVLFTLAHPELLAAAIWCAGINWVLYRTKNLWACITAHAVTNLLLGVYILATGSWALW